jgi:hypothetical protein
MAITVQELIEELQGFPAESEVFIADNDMNELFLTDSVLRDDCLTLTVVSESEREDNK